MSKSKKDVKPISARKTGELARLLEERGVGDDIVRRTMIENPNGLCFFLRGKALGDLFGKTITIKKEDHWVIEIVDEKIFGVAYNIEEYAMGNIVRVGNRVKMRQVDSSFLSTEVTEIKFGPSGELRTFIIGVDLLRIGRTTHFWNVLEVII